MQWQNYPSYWVFLSIVSTDRKDIRQIVENATGYNHYDGNTFYSNRLLLSTNELRIKEAERLASLLPCGTEITVFFAKSDDSVLCNPYFNPLSDNNHSLDTIKCTGDPIQGDHSGRPFKPHEWALVFSGDTSTLKNYRATKTAAVQTK